MGNLTRWCTGLDTRYVCSRAYKIGLVVGKVWVDRGGGNELRMGLSLMFGCGLFEINQ